MDAADFERRAQTNIRLYGQLVAAGYASDDLGRVRDAYALATTLFASQLRPEGRPFLCHLVGVASILAFVDAPASAVIGGLLHSAYSHGDFGHGPGHVTDAARRRVRAVVGEEVERLLTCYSRYPWNARTVDDWLAQPAALESDTRQIAVIRLADTLEDALDHGLKLSSKASNPHRAVAVERIVALADAMGYPSLGAALEQLGTATTRPELLALREPHAGSYVVAPSSWREKTLPRLMRFVRRARARE